MFTKKMIIFSLAVISFQNAVSVRHDQYDQGINPQEAFHQDNLNHEQREVFRNEPPVIQQNRAEENQNNLNDDNLTDEQRAERGLFHNEPPLVELQVDEPEQRIQDDQDAPALLVSEQLKKDFEMPDYPHPNLRDLMQNPVFGEAMNHIEWQGELQQQDFAIIVDIRNEENTQIIIPKHSLKRVVKKFKAKHRALLRKSIYLKLEKQKSNIWLAEIDSGLLED